MEQEPHGDQPGEKPAEPQQRMINENRVRQRAYEIWIDEGRPDGRALNHWLRAKWELENAADLKETVDRLEHDVKQE